MYYDDINVTKRKTITNGEKYDFFVYNLLPLEKNFLRASLVKETQLLAQIKNLSCLMMKLEKC